VAIKTLRVLDPSEVACWRREVHALSRLRDPGIVAIREQGVESGRPWYAMELIEGGTIDSLWQRRATGGLQGSGVEELRPALISLRQLCETLAFLHGEGIVHRDLKPANIVLRPDGRPVLVDFGFVTHFGTRLSRETLEVAGEVLGSLQYMAPEQARGEFVDARADLYSLGCILYEVFTGRPPFVGHASDVLHQQLYAEPQAPSTYVGEVSPTVDQLILRLLAKDPHDRIGYAADVAAQLRLLTSDVSEENHRMARMYLYRPGFAGRTEPLQQLTVCVRRLQQGRGGLAFVAGESGVGKTRLAMEVSRRAAADDLIVVTGQCASLEGATHASDTQGGPLHPFLPLLRYIADYCLEHGAEVADRIVGRRGKVLAVYEPSLATLPGQDQFPEPVALQAQAARERVVGDLAEMLTLFAGERRLIVVLDDLQWADELTLYTLSSLPLQFYERAPLLVIGCYRSEEMGPNLRALANAPCSTRVNLGRLDTPSVGHIVSDMLAIRPVPEPLIRFVAGQSEGNPFFVSEYLRMVVGERLLVRAAGGQWQVAASGPEGQRAYDSLPLPQTIRELVGRRLEAVRGDARRVIEAAAVLGRDFEVPLAAAVCHLEDPAQMDAVTELLAAQIVEEVTGDRLRFTHDKLREVAYAGLSPAESQVLHNRAAVAIENRYRDTADFARWYGALGVHWQSAGNDEPAARYFAGAGEIALRAGAGGDARLMLSRALSCEKRCTPRASHVQRAQWLRMLGEAAFGTGDITGTIAHTSEALTELGRSPAQSQVGWVVRLLSECVGLLRQPYAPRQRDEANDIVEAARCAGQVTTAYYLRSEVIAGLSNSLRCVNLAHVSRTHGAATQSYAHIGYIAGSARLASLARTCFSRARELRQVADPNVFGGSLYFEAIYETGLGNWERSRELGEEAVRLLEGLGNRQEAEIANAIVANSLFYQGRFNESERRCRAIHESASARGNAHHSAWGLFLAGRSLLCMGQLSEALLALQQGRALLEPLDDFLSKIMCDGSLARAYLYAGDRMQAAEMASVLEQRIRSRWVIPLVQCLDGVAALPEVAIALSQRSADPQLVASARYGCRALRRFSHMFPIARPVALRQSGWLLCAHRAHRRALRLWERSRLMAVRLRMPYEEARANQALAAYVTSRTQRERHKSIAHRLFTQLGCAHHLVELCADSDPTA
jgi:tetratricopeptide (TPR) repeat protein